MSLLSLTPPTVSGHLQAEPLLPSLAGQIAPSPLQVTLPSSGGHLPEVWSRSVSGLRTVCGLRIGPHPAQPTAYSRRSHTSFLCPHGGHQEGKDAVSSRSPVVISGAAPAPGEPVQVQDDVLVGWKSFGLGGQPPRNGLAECWPNRMSETGFSFFNNK